MSIEIIDKLKQKNNGTFKLIDLEDVDYDGTGTSTKDKIEELVDNQITLEKDDTSFDGVDDTIHDNLTTTDKRIIGAINEVNAQFKDIAKQVENVGQPTDEQLANIIQSKIDDGTLPNMTIKENSITGDKINGSAIDYPKKHSTESNSVKGKYVQMEGTIGVEPSMAYFTVDVLPNTKYEIKSVTSGIFFGEFNGDTLVKIFHEWDGLNNTTGMHTITTNSNTNNLKINMDVKSIGTANYYCKQIGKQKIKLNWLDTYFMSKWYGKKAVIIGDSITAGSDGSTSGASVVPTESNFPSQLKLKLNLNNIINYGQAGTTIAQTSGNDNGMGSIAFVNRFKNMDDDADLIIVFGGTNDYGISYTTDFGTPADTEKTTFYGALNYLCNGLIEKYKGKTIVFLTPLHRDIETANTKGKTLIDYVNAIKEVCQIWGIPVIDAYNLSGFTPKNSSFKSEFLPDGLHPNETGYKLLAERIYKNFELI